IWDTVGALGVPTGLFFANYFNRKYEFHDLALSRMVKSARHVLSIDERRRTFVATPWTNIDELNRAAAGASMVCGRLPSSGSSRGRTPAASGWIRRRSTTIAATSTTPCRSTA